jgi:hypothetical protein
MAKYGNVQQLSQAVEEIERKLDAVNIDAAVREAEASKKPKVQGNAEEPETD